MTDKVTLTNVATFTNDSTATAAVNANNAAITTAMDNTLSRDGTAPNQMLSTLDMNNQRLINLPSPGGLNDPVRFGDLNVTAPAVTFGSPSNLIGLTANNGVLNLALRSDATPALNQAIAPTWTATHTFFNGNINPIVIFSANGLVSGTLYVDNFNQILTSNTGGIISNTVVPSTAAANKFATAISNTGVVTYTQPSAANLSNGVTGTGAIVLANAPALLGSASAVSLTLSGAFAVTGNTSLTGSLAGSVAAFTGTVTGLSTTAVTSGGAATAAYTVGTTQLGVYFGSGAPTISAPQGSLYLRTDGSSTSTRMYVNQNGSTTWTSVTTAA